MLSETDLRGIEAASKAVASLSQVQVEAIERLLVGQTPEQIKQDLKISPALWSKWNRDTSFINAIGTARGVMMMTRLHELKVSEAMQVAVEQLINVMQNAAMDKDKIAAAQVVNLMWNDAMKASSSERKAEELKQEIANLRAEMKQERSMRVLDKRIRATSANLPMIEDIRGEEPRDYSADAVIPPAPMTPEELEMERAKNEEHQ